MKSLPSEWTPLNILAWLHETFSICGCSEIDQILKTLEKTLSWSASIKDRVPFIEFFSDAGMFYLVMNILDREGLIEHGCSIRCPWLLEDGEKLLAALKDLDFSSVEDATGLAYNGITY